MIVFQYRQKSPIDKLKEKEFIKAWSEITDAEIISIDPDPLKIKQQTTTDIMVKDDENK